MIIQVIIIMLTWSLQPVLENSQISPDLIIATGITDIEFSQAIKEEEVFVTKPKRSQSQKMMAKNEKITKRWVALKERIWYQRNCVGLYG